MLKRIVGFIYSGFIVLNLTGCIPLLAGAAGGAGAAAWLSGKLTQQFNASYDQTVDAARAALRSLNYPISKETKHVDVAQFRSETPDNKEVWVDIHRLTDISSKVEVRAGVGTSDDDKAAAERILKAIDDRL